VRPAGTIASGDVGERRRNKEEEGMSITRRTFTMATLFATGAAVLPVRVKAEGVKTIAIMFDSLQSGFWVESLDVLKQKAKERGWETLESISNLDDNKQFEQVQSMIQRKVDGIIIVPTDNKATIPAIREANKANTPIVYYNRPPAPGDYVAVAVQADNRAIMKATTEALVAKARKTGQKFQACFLIGDLGDQNAVQRRDGFFDVVDQNKDIIDVVARISTEWNPDKAFAGLTNALQANPGINYLQTSSDFLMPQIQQALTIAKKWKKIGEEGHILFGGFDGDEGQYQALKDGYMDVGGVQNVFYEADLALDAISKLKAGQPVPLMPKMLLDPGFVMTHETVEQDRDKMWGYAVWKKKNG
jgi:ABC-type sugar transport system substrate-binding protein